MADTEKKGSFFQNFGGRFQSKSKADKRISAPLISQSAEHLGEGPTRSSPVQTPKRNNLAGSRSFSLGAPTSISQGQLVDEAETEESHSDNESSRFRLKFMKKKKKTNSVNFLSTTAKKNDSKLNSGPQLSTSDLTNGATDYGGLIDSTVGPGMFNDGYEKGTENGKFVPRALKDCCEYVEQTGVTVKGIYRVNGGASKINQIKGAYHRDEPIDLNELNYNPHVVSGVIKCFIREQEPLLPKSTLLLMNECIGIKNDTERVKLLKTLIDKIPPGNHLVLKYLIAHLMRIAEHSEENCMTIENIAVVFFPTSKIPTILISDLMKNFDELLGGEELDDKEGSNTFHEKTESQEEKNEGTKKEVEEPKNDKVTKNESEESKKEVDEPKKGVDKPEEHIEKEAGKSEGHIEKGVGNSEEEIEKETEISEDELEKVVTSKDESKKDTVKPEEKSEKEIVKSEEGSEKEIVESETELNKEIMKAGKKTEDKNAIQLV